MLDIVVGDVEVGRHVATLVDRLLGGRGLRGRHGQLVDERGLLVTGRGGHERHVVLGGRHLGCR